MKYLLPCAVVCLMLSACGGDDTADSSGESSDSATQSLDAAMTEINEAMDTGECAEVVTVVNRTTSGLYKSAEDPPKSLCKNYVAGLVPILEQVDFDRSQQFGPAAIIEGSPPKDDTEAAVFVGVVLQDPFADDEWTYAYGAGDTLEQIETEPVDPEGVEQTAQDFLDALESQDCARFAATIHPAMNAIPGGKPEEICDLYFTGPFGKTYAKGEGTLESLGGTIDYAFFKLTPGDESRTDTMILNIVGDSEDGKMAVVDVLPSPQTEG